MNLPLLESGQVQKHLIVNEAMARIDGLFMLSVKGRFTETPPTDAVEGDRWIIPTGATGDWTGAETKIAVFIGGGWDILEPLIGWRCWVEDEDLEVLYDNNVWTPRIYGPPALTGTLQEVDIDQALSGASVDTAGVIPAGALVYAVTARVTTAIAGPSGWSLGIADAPTRYGSGLGVGTGVAAAGPVGAPLGYSQALPLRITAEGAPFSAGLVRLRIHYMTFSVPEA